MIGRYKCAICLQSEDQDIMDDEPDIIMLCNPWCEADTVYLPTAVERDEYVLNDTGNIWRGTKRSNSGMNWIFGQFEDKVLDTALHLIMNDKRIKSHKAELKRFNFGCFLFCKTLIFGYFLKFFNFVLRVCPKLRILCGYHELFQLVQIPAMITVCLLETGQVGCMESPPNC